jgi:hypothetical protein
MKNAHGARTSFRRGALSILGMLLTLGCGSEKVPGGSVGEIQVALSLPDGTAINSVAWKVLSSSSAQIASGTLNTSGSRSPSFITSLPAGASDTVVMTATTTGGVTCAGTSSPFTIIAGQSTTVNLNVVCENTPADGGSLGSVVVSSTLVAGDHCPELTQWFISPQSTTGSNPIDVSVTGSDADVGDTLSYAWTATAGSFTSPSSAMTQYTCAATGAPTLTVAISDNHMPTPCTTRVTFPSVSCQ